MKPTLGILAALFLAGGKAIAADIAVPAAPPPNSYYPTPPAAYNWSGPYLGLNGGYASGQSNWNDPNNPATTTGDFPISGFVVGGTVGVNFQYDMLVLGAETDFDYSTIRGTTAPANGFCSLLTATLATTTNCNTQNTWLGTIRARAGLAFNRVLLFGTGGLAYGDINSGAAGGGVTPIYDSSIVPGWTVGGGLELAMSHHWTAKVEYLYVRLADGACTSGNCGYNFDVNTFTLSPAGDTVKFSASLVRFGINYKFDWE